MPLTFAHPAAVLPFSRNSKHVNFLALVLGSMSPDFEYFLRGKPYGEIGHTFLGFITFNLPILVAVYFIYQTCIHKTLFSQLPSVLQDTYSQKKSSTIFLRLFVFLYSALFGMLTHVTWDSFTHSGGFMVKNLSFLSNNIQIYGLSIPIYKFLQHGSTLVGISLIIIYMYYRTAKYGFDSKRASSSSQKIKYWGQITLLTSLIFCLWHLIDKISIDSYGIIVVRLIDSALISLLVISLVFNYSNKTETVNTLLK